MTQTIPKATDPEPMSCPRCGLTIRPRRPWLTVEHCPRCLAHARLPIPLVPIARGPVSLLPAHPVPEASRLHRPV